MFNPDRIIRALVTMEERFDRLEQAHISHQKDNQGRFTELQHIYKQMGDDLDIHVNMADGGGKIRNALHLAIERLKADKLQLIRALDVLDSRLGRRAGPANEHKSPLAELILYDKKLTHESIICSAIDDYNTAMQWGGEFEKLGKMARAAGNLTHQAPAAVAPTFAPSTDIGPK